MCLVLCWVTYLFWEARDLGGTVFFALLALANCGLVVWAALLPKLRHIREDPSSGSKVARQDS